MTWTTRLRSNAALHGLPPERTGRKGRPRLKGNRLPGSATKGAKDYDCAMTGILLDDTPDGREDNGHAFLLLRRHRYTGTVSYYLCWSRALSRWRS